MGVLITSDKMLSVTPASYKLTGAPPVICVLVFPSSYTAYYVLVVLLVIPVPSIRLLVLTGNYGNQCSHSLTTYQG